MFSRVKEQIKALGTALTNFLVQDAYYNSVDLKMAV